MSYFQICQDFVYAIMILHLNKKEWLNKMHKIFYSFWNIGYFKCYCIFFFHNQFNSVSKFYCNVRQNLKLLMGNSCIKFKSRQNIVRPNKFTIKWLNIYLICIKTVESFDLIVRSILTSHFLNILTPRLRKLKVLGTTVWRFLFTTYFFILGVEF